MQRPLTIFISMTLLAAACSGGDPSGPQAQSNATPASNAGSDVGPRAEGSTVELLTIPPEFDQADLLPCTIGALPSSQLVVAYAQVGFEDVGPNADRFRVLIDDYLDRCGGDVEVRTFDLGNPDTCDQISQLGPVLTVTDAASPADVACIAEGTLAPVWHEAGLPAGLLEQTAATVVSTDVAPDVAASDMVALMSAEGLLEGRSVAVVYGSGEATVSIATDGLAGSLPDAELLAIDGDACDVSAPDADVVFAVVAPGCLAELVDATAGSPLWAVVASDEMLADSSSAVLDSVNDRLDGAVAFAALPVNGGGWPRALGPDPRDKACNQRLDSLVGTSTPYPSLSWSAGSRLCATTYGVLQALVAAGEAPTNESLSAAITSVSEVPLPRGLLGASTAEEPWLAGAETFALEWSSDCVCWNFVAGPLGVAG